MISPITVRAIQAIIGLLVIFFIVPLGSFIFGKLIQRKCRNNILYRIVQITVILIIFTWSALRYCKIVSFNYNYDPTFFGDFSPVFGVYWAYIGVLFIIGTVAQYFHRK